MASTSTSANTIKLANGQQVPVPELDRNRLTTQWALKSRSNWPPSACALISDYMRENGFYSATSERSASNHENQLRRRLFDELAQFEYEEEKDIITTAIKARLPAKIKNLRAVMAGQKEIITIDNHAYPNDGQPWERFKTTVLYVGFESLCSKLQMTPLKGALEVLNSLSNEDHAAIVSEMFRTFGDQDRLRSEPGVRNTLERVPTPTSPIPPQSELPNPGEDIDTSDSVDAATALLQLNPNVPQHSKSRKRKLSMSATDAALEALC